MIDRQKYLPLLAEYHAVIFATCWDIEVAAGLADKLGRLVRPEDEAEAMSLQRPEYQRRIAP